MNNPAPSKNAEKRQVVWRLNLTKEEAEQHKNAVVRCEGCGQDYRLTHGPRCPNCDCD